MCVCACLTACNNVAVVLFRNRSSLIFYGIYKHPRWEGITAVQISTIKVTNEYHYAYVARLTIVWKIWLVTLSNCKSFLAIPKRQTRRRWIQLRNRIWVWVRSRRAIWWVPNRTRPEFICTIASVRNMKSKWESDVKPGAKFQVQPITVPIIRKVVWHG